MPILKRSASGHRIEKKNLMEQVTSPTFSFDLSSSSIGWQVPGSGGAQQEEWNGSGTYTPSHDWMAYRLTPL